MHSSILTHMIHINLNTMFYTPTEQSPTNAIYVKYEAKTNKKTSECNEFKPFVHA